MGKEKYVIKTGAGDYLKKGYPLQQISGTYTMRFVIDIKKARRFNSIEEADKVRSSCLFLRGCEIIKIEEDD